MRHARLQDEVSSDDSFLDVVANVVGVLIILVMLVGAQASRGVLVAESEQPVVPEMPSQEKQDLKTTSAQLNSELEQVTQATLASERAIREVSIRVAKISNEAQAVDQQRVTLAMHRSVLQEDIETRRQTLGKQEQKEFDVQRQLLEAKLDLDKLNQEQLNLISMPDTVTEVETVPTPLAKVVEGRSIHLRLSKGLVSIVPFDALMEETQSNLEGTRRRLQDNSRVVETFGPLDGYRLKLTIAKRSSRDVGGPRVGHMPRVKIGWEAELVPTSAELGENVEQALLPTGMLYRYLQTQRRESPAVVVWLYTDSFDEFRPLKRALWEMGFPMATRPMRPGTNIKASPEGTRAAAQ